MATIILRPVANGDSVTLSITGAAANWDCVDDSTPDGNATYVSTLSIGSDVYTIAGNSLSVSDTINSVTVYCEVRVTSTSHGASGTVAPIVRYGGVSYLGVNLGVTSTSYLTYSST